MLQETTPLLTNLSHNRDKMEQTPTRDGNTLVSHEATRRARSDKANSSQSAIHTKIARITWY